MLRWVHVCVFSKILLWFSGQGIFEVFEFHALLVFVLQMFPGGYLFSSPDVISFLIIQQMCPDV